MNEYSNDIFSFGESTEASQDQAQNFNYSNISGLGESNYENEDLFKTDFNQEQSINSGLENSSVNQEQIDTNPSTLNSNENELTSLTVEGNELIPEFNSNIFDYRVNLADGTNVVKVTATAKGTSQVSGTGSYAVFPGQNLINVIVTDALGNSKTYKIILSVKEAVKEDIPQPELNTDASGLYDVEVSNESNEETDVQVQEPEEEPQISIDDLDDDIFAQYAAMNSDENPSQTSEDNNFDMSFEPFTSVESVPKTEQNIEQQEKSNVQAVEESPAETPELNLDNENLFEQQEKNDDNLFEQNYPKVDQLPDVDEDSSEFVVEDIPKNIEISDTPKEELEEMMAPLDDDNIENTDINSLFDEVSVNVKEASDIFRKNTEMKSKIDSRFEELKKLQAEVNASKKEQMEEIDRYKEEVLSKLSEKKEEVEKRLNLLKESQAAFEAKMKDFEEYRKQEQANIDKVQKEVQAAYDERREELNKIEDNLRTQKEALDEEKNQLSMDKIQYEADKNDLANNLLKFNELVNSFTSSVNETKE